MAREYNHDYATCDETYATLCVYHHDLDPDAVSHLLELRPTRSQRRGDVRNPNAAAPVPLPTGAWFLCTRDASRSRDVRFHIDLLLRVLAEKGDAIRQLAAQGCQLRIDCYWESAHGHGGPMIWPETMARLAELGIELGFDVYFYGEDGRPPRATPEAP
ncbi:MAG: DUF4279 domain-containing protein [Planctomycetes bacterium]|nr:DUF4279 domain-containing protein [Planctomycetota bacterium]